MEFNFDPNMNMSGRMSTKTVFLTFGLWEYRRSIVVKVSGNISGLSVIEFAVEQAYEELGHTFLMTRSNGDDLLVSDEDERDVEWLGDMLISAQITSMVPAGSL